MRQYSRSFAPEAIAYSVPFRAKFLEDGTTALIENVSEERLNWVRVDLIGVGMMTPVSPGSMEPGDQIQVRVRGANWENTTRIQLSWLRADDSGPFVWQCVQ
ncbi:hypothetical protein [Humidisolicoccus flavus]|uniref:hypothetical protein n=1 Tax=Humidisolicoccus flavus TaxID=3111414 RepID=UPI00324A5F9E